MSISSARQGTSSLLTRVVVVFIALVLGCGKSNKPILPANIQQSSESQLQEMIVTHPEYANWSRFPVGCQVVRFRVVSNKAGKVEVTSTWKLANKTEQFVETVFQINVQRPGEDLQVNPPETTRFPASFQLPKGLTEEFFQLPNIKAKKVGEETLDVSGKSIVAEVFEWIESNEAGPMTVKLWRSNEVPGRIVRQEMLIESSQTKTVEEVREVTW